MDKDDYTCFEHLKGIFAVGFHGIRKRAVRFYEEL